MDSIANRKSGIFTAGISALVILIYFSGHKIPIDNSLEQENDFTAKSYLHNFKSQRYDDSGILKEIISSKIALDIPRANEIQLTKPSIEMHDENNNTWVASADFGVMKKHNSLLTLKNNVLVKHNNTGSLMETNEIQFDLSNRIAQTDQKIEISRSGSLTQAKGMQADLGKSKLKLLTEVRTIYFDGNE